MSFPYNPNIPFKTNSPASDQPEMLKNFGTINDWVQVDHVDFNDSNGGKHEQVTFSGNHVPAAQSLVQSVLYTNNVATGADPNHPQLFWVNANATFHFPIRAWGAVLPAGGIDTNQSFNITSATRTSAGNYTITLAAGATSSDHYGVIITPGRTQPGNLIDACGYVILSTTQFQVFTVQPENTANGRDAYFSFMVLQI